MSRATSRRMKLYLKASYLLHLQNPRLRLFETDTTDLNTQLQNQAGDFFIKTIPDDASTSTNRLAIDHATGDISFYEDTGTTPKFFWDASAESLGIGLTTGISSKLHVNTEMSIGADADNRAIVGYTPSRFYIGTRQGGTNYFDTVSVSAGNVGIGLDGDYKLDVLNTTGNVVLARFTTTATSTTEYGAQIVLTNDPNDTTRYFLEGDGGGAARFRIYSNGNMVNQNNSYTGISDEKLKENIVDAGSQWDDIKALRVRKYSFKEENASEPTQIGVIAQEVEAAGMSGLVYETADQDTAEDGSFVDTGEVTKTMKYSILYMKAVKALQEAMDRIETLEAQVAALES